MDALIVHGHAKPAADAINCAHSTLSDYVKKAQKRMGERSRLHAILKWARWRWEREKAGGSATTNGANEATNRPLDL